MRGKKRNEKDGERKKLKRRDTQGGNQGGAGEAEADGGTGVREEQGPRRGDGRVGILDFLPGPLRAPSHRKKESLAPRGLYTFSLTPSRPARNF